MNVHRTLPDELCPRPLAPRAFEERATPLEAQLLLERYRVLAMAMATRVIAGLWDTGLVAHRAEATLVSALPPAGESTSDEEELPAAGASPFPLEQEVLALIGVSRDRAPDRVREAERGVVQALEDLTAESDKLGATRLPLDELAAELELDAMSKLMLMLVAAPQLWGAVHQLYRLAGNDPRRGAVDEDLLIQLLGPRVNPHLVAQQLAGAAPLISSGLVVCEAGAFAPPLTPLRVAPLVLARLRGNPLLVDPERQEIARTPMRLSQIVIGQEAIEALVEWSERDPVLTRLVLRGRRSSGRTTLLAALAHAARRRLEKIDLARLAAAGGHLLTELAQALSRCRVAGWVPCITGFELLGSTGRELREAVGVVLDEYQGPMVLRLEQDELPPIAPGYRLVELPQLSESQRLEMWREELERHQLSTDEHSILAARWRVGPGTIRHVVASVAASRRAGADSQSPAALEPRELVGLVDRVTTQHLQNRLGDVAERVRELPRLSDMVLPTDILDSLTEFIARNRLGHRVYEQWGMAKVATTGRGLTALFQGAPGTGKTMVAGALARELGRDLYRVDLSRIMSKWMGETERNLANVFAAAEDGHAIVLFDEADSLFTKRTEVKSSNDRHANVEVNYLLQRLDSFIGIAILTTNFGTAIDPAFKRRLSFRLTFPLPDEEIREQLWLKHLPPQLPTGKLDVTDLARKYHLTGGAVRNCVMRAAFLAAAEEQILTQDHLLRAIRLEYRSVGKLSEGGPLE